MTDNELRGVILRKYYDRRREQNIRLEPSDFVPPIDETDIVFISDQLAEHGLIHWQPIKTDSHGLIDGMGHISASGVDVVEDGGVGAPIRVTFDQSIHYSVNGSSGVQIGNGNVQADTKGGVL